VSVLFSGEVDYDHCDTPLPIGEEDNLDIFDEVCHYRQRLPKTFPPDNRTALCVLLFYQI
jgi:hypothetical protein